MRSRPPSLAAGRTPRLIPRRAWRRSRGHAGCRPRLARSVEGPLVERPSEGTGRFLPGVSRCRRSRSRDSGRASTSRASSCPTAPGATATSRSTCARFGPTDPRHRRSTARLRWCRGIGVRPLHAAHVASTPPVLGQVGQKPHPAACWRPWPPNPRFKGGRRTLWQAGHRDLDDLLSPRVAYSRGDERGTAEFLLAVYPAACSERVPYGYCL